MRLMNSAIAPLSLLVAMSVLPLDVFLPALDLGLHALIVVDAIRIAGLVLADADECERLSAIDASLERVAEKGGRARS